MTLATAEKGAEAEERAARFLERQGLCILQRNYRTRQGEVDVIAQEGATLVFVEVRARRSLAFGGAAASVNRAKQRRIEAAARHYLLRLGSEPPCRFDVLAWQGTQPEPAWIRGAFEAT